MFITAGSCSVMLLWPTRRIAFCQGSAAGSIGGRRTGSEMRRGGAWLAGGTETSCAERVKLGSRRFIAAAIGMALALVLRNERRLSIGTPPNLPAKEV